MFVFLASVQIVQIVQVGIIGAIKRGFCLHGVYTVYQKNYQTFANQSALAYISIVQVTFNVKLPALVKKEKRGQMYISSCPILDVHSQGESRQKALANLQEALRLFFLSCFERGTLDEVLKKCGFQPLQKRAFKPQPFPRKYESIDLPLPFQIPSKVDLSECRV